jgi:HK97 family phage portal protein
MQKKNLIKNSSHSPHSSEKNTATAKPSFVKEMISAWWDKITQRRHIDSELPLSPYGTSITSIVPREFDPQRAVREGLKASDVVYSCCRILADALGSVPFLVEKWNASKNEWVRVPGHPLEILLARPNPFQGRAEIMETAAYHLDLAGNSLFYINVVDGRPQEITAINPQHIEVVADPINFIKCYRYSNGTGTMYLSPDIVCHTRFVDPENPWWGMSPLQAAALTVDTDIAAGMWNREAMANRAQPDLIISPENDLTELQYDLFRTSMKESIQGAGNARNPILMSSKARVEKMSFSPTEMDFMNSRTFNREAICGAFRTPAPLVIFDQAGGSMNNNLSPVYRFFWENTVMPVLDRIVESLNQTLIPFYGKEEKLRIRADYTQVRALQVSNLDNAKIALIYSQIGIPFQSYNKLLQLGFPDDVDIVPEQPAMGRAPANVDRLHAIEDNTQSGMTNGNSNSVPADDVVQ